jgi:hypothetical protein
MGNFLKRAFNRIVGIESIEAAKQEAERLRIEAEAAAVAAVKEAALAKAQAEEAKKQEELAKLAPKERATAQGIPYVTVLDTHVNTENVRNGFFELDWNNLFIQELIKAGYGTEANPEEEIVDRWFRDLARNILSEEGYENNLAGSINVVNINDARK